MAKRSEGCGLVLIRRTGGLQEHYFGFGTLFYLRAKDKNYVCTEKCTRVFCAIY